VRWVRNAAGFLTAITTDDGASSYATGIEWDAQERLRAWTAGNGVSTTVGYDPTTGRLASLFVGSLLRAGYLFDDADRLSMVNDPFTGDLRQFTYDGLDRLTVASGPFGAGGAPTTLNYEYDAVGNLKCLEATNLTGCVGGTAFTYPSGQAPIRPNAPLSVGVQTATHDAGGNVRFLGSREYRYNSLGQLTNVLNGSTQIVDFQYDADGQAVRRSVTNGETRHFVAPDFDWIQGTNRGQIHIGLGETVIATHDEAYNPGGGGGCAAALPGIEGVDLSGWLWLFGPGVAAVLVLRVGRALGRRGPGARLRPAVALGTGMAFVVVVVIPPAFLASAREAQAAFADDVAYYHGDHLGSTRFTTAAGGQVVEQADYRPFGRTVPLAGGGTPSAPEFGFTAQRYAGDAEIYDFGARFYDPKMGRFLQPDPIVADVLGPQGFNPYAYVRNSPTNLVDPLGLQAEAAATIWPGPCDGLSCVDVPIGGDVYRWYRDSIGDAGLTNVVAAPFFEGIPGFLPGGIASGTLELGPLIPADIAQRAASQSGGAIGAPGFAESLIPVWGSGRAAINDFQEGSYGWAAFNAAVAVSDVFLVGAAAKGIAKGAFKVGSHTWRATRSWYGQTRGLAAGTPVHHWLVEQGSAIGKQVPDAIKNQPWNLMPMRSQAFHNQVHGWGPDGFNAAGQLWYGTPPWAKAGAFSTTGHGVEAYWGP
jgi:RHS repeat-associated protein